METLYEYEDQKGRDKNSQNGFILVSANGGLNQQRVAVCNAVAVASLLNATLVIPKFLYSNVWKDPSQFSDIYQEDTFMNTLKDDVDIVKDIPSHVNLIDLDAIGSLVTDSNLSKEATPNEYIKSVLPILLRNGIVHFLGFGNRLGFDLMPSEIQKLRCKCNFHALKFVPKIQQTGSILLKRIRNYNALNSTLDKQLLGNFTSDNYSTDHFNLTIPSKYLALHMRFEVDMVAYSMCDFGGGENETKELQAYREEHFPLLLERMKKMKYYTQLNKIPSCKTGYNTNCYFNHIFFYFISSWGTKSSFVTCRPTTTAELRMMGRCPLTPEEAGLVLAGLGFDRKTYIYLAAGSQIYGGKSRMHPLNRLYPNIVTKEDFLTPSELKPYRKFSSQLAALDLIACAASNFFAMTETGSQFSSLVSGFRIYHGGGNAPTLRPNKKRLAVILQGNSKIEWRSFETRITKMIEASQRVSIRRNGTNIYRQPRCSECMCHSVT